MPTNLNELKQGWKGERAKIPPLWCDKLIKSHRKPLLQVIAVKGSSITLPLLMEGP